MRAFKTRTAEKIKEMRISKADLFEGVESIDFALPQEWLNEFSDWVERKTGNKAYDLIRSTTVWKYSGILGSPMTRCEEVYQWWKQWDSSIEA